ncbi:MAG TPA: histidine kinase [Marinilabiliaceae bacterium]|nr:histidine kinase [Marinilabiliaceae bacterium]HBX89576.1 histidine kinase [Marinilabiliaceae bacterium]
MAKLKNKTLVFLMREITIPVFLALVVLSSFGCAQRQNRELSDAQSPNENVLVSDSLIINQLIERSESFFKDTGPRAEEFDAFLLEALDLAERRNLITHEIIIYNIVGKRYRNRSHYGEALKHHHRALSLAQSINNTELLAEIYNQIGVVYRRTDDNSMALDMHFKALKLAEEVSDSFNISVSINSIGNVNYNLGRYHTAIEYLLRSLELSKNAGNIMGMAINTNNIGECMLKLGEPDSALVYFRKSLDYNSQLGNRVGQSICFNSIGAAYIAKGEFEKAKNYLERSLQINRKLSDRMQIAMSLGKVGEVNLMMGNYEEAKDNLFESFEISSRIGSRFQAEESARLISLFYEKTNDYPKSLEYYKISTQYKDSILNEKNMNHLTTIEATMDAEAQRDQIQHLNRETLEQQSVLIRQRQMLVISITVLIILIVVVSLLVFQHRLRTKYNNLKNQQKLLRSQLNPHFIFNALSAIQVYVLEHDTEKSTRFLTDFAKLMRMVLKLSHYDYISLKNECEILEYYLSLQQLRFLEPFDYRIIIDPSIESDAVLVPPMITQPFVENAVEHGIKDIHGKGLLDIRYKQVNDQMIIEVEDNGIGINNSMQQKSEKTRNHESMATKITKERLEVIRNDSGGKVALEIIDKKDVNPFDHGTLVRIILPLVDQVSSKSINNG